MKINTKFEISVIESMLKELSSTNKESKFVSFVSNLVLYMLLTLVFLMTSNNQIPIKIGLVSVAVLSFIAGVMFLYRQHRVRNQIIKQYYDLDKITKRIIENKT